jgi:hypothetical protein
LVVAAGSFETSSGRRAAADPRGTWAAFRAIAALAFVYLLWEGRGNTFVYDEWSWIEVLRSGPHSILAS